MVVGIVRIIGVLLTRAEGMILVHVVAQKVALEEMLWSRSNVRSRFGVMYMALDGACGVEKVNDGRGYAVARGWAAITMERLIELVSEETTTWRLGEFETL